MAPATPQRKKRAAQNNYVTNIGEQGRKTGLTLPEQPRDEYGMEPADSLFTSPMKSARTGPQSRRKSDVTDSSSEAMDVVDSSAPEVAEVLSIRASQKRTSIPPPTRSPLRKTNIGGSPRRHQSLGTTGSSPERNRTPEVASSPQRSVHRLLNFSMNESLPSPERLILKQASSRTNELSNGKRRSVYSIEQTPLAGRNKGDTHDDDDDEEEEDEGASTIGFDEPQIVEDDDGMSDVGLAGIDDDDGGIGQTDVEERAHAEAKASSSRKSRRTTRLSTSSERRASTRQSEASAMEPSLLEQNEENEPAEGGDLEGKAEAGQEAEIAPPPKKRGRGRPPKSETQAKKALEKKDANAAVKRETQAKSKARPKPKNDNEAAPREARAGSVTSLQRGREYTPNEDDGATFTRSGRLSYRPLSYWKGEEAKYASDGRHGMQTIFSLVRKEDVTPVKRQVRTRKKRKYNVYTDEHSGEEAGAGEEAWENEEGVVSGMVSEWDPETGGSSGEREQELAFAGSAIVARDVAGADFRYAKTLTLGYFGTGIVELPPRGFKRMKNSRKMTMVFFVHYGKVAVDVAGTRFTISKGGVWQVPRGNLYSITNETEHEAKIFFAQGCEEIVERPPIEQLE